MEAHRAPSVRPDQHQLGRPLESFEVIVNYIRTTVTPTGLRVRAERNTKTYKKCIRITKPQMADLNLHRDKTLP